MRKVFSMYLFLILKSCYKKYATNQGLFKHWLKHKCPPLDVMMYYLHNPLHEASRAAAKV